MKAVRSTEGGVAVVDVDEPPGIGHVLDMRATSICGSDLSYIRFGSRNILGHELAGVREDGTAVVVEAIYGCMECEQCRRGAYNLCPTHGQRALGIGADGGMAEQFRAPGARMVPLPSGFDVRDASIVEPAAVSWHALRLAATGPGTSVGVVGAGALGLLAVAGARRLGAEDVALEARHPHQKEAGERLGRGSAPTGCTTSWSRRPGPRRAWPGAVSWSLPAGRSSSSACISAPSSWTGCPCSTRRRVSSRRWGTAPTTADGRWRTPPPCWPTIPPSRRTLITHRFPIEDAVEAFRVASDRAGGAVRVVIEPS